MNIHKQLAIISIIIFGAGIAIATPISLSWLQQQKALATTPVSPIATTVAAPTQTSPDVVQGLPRHISVPSLSINTNVMDGTYDAATGEWTLSEDSAFFGTPTSPANSVTGNTLIYGHNSTKIFGKLLGIQPGAEVIVTTDNDAEFTYVFRASEAVKPTDVVALAPTEKPQLTLQTCSGIWNETRQMFYFDLKSYKKA